MRESLSDSSEDLYSFSTTTTADIFDFSETESFLSDQVALSAQTGKSLLAVLKNLLLFFQALVWRSFSISFELMNFVVVYLLYLRAKVAGVVSLFDISKDKFVDTLMWRRGLLFRPATHGGVIVVTALAVVAGGLFTRGQISAQDLTVQESILRSSNTTETIVPTNRPRSEVLDYKVASGDSLSGLANKFGVSVDTIKWANSMTDDSLRPDTTLKIPPVTGVVYKVKSGDTLDSVAKTYTADKQTIVDFPFNYIDDSLTLKVGQTLFVPNGSIPEPAKPRTFYASRPITYTFVAGSGFLSWPVPRTISQYFSWYHTALDLDDPYGTPIYAAHDGIITEAKKQTYSFGWYCTESFGDGWTISYAHMSAQACYVGQTVARGQYLGNIGATGRATGPHLHFEVRHNGDAVDPLTLLP